MKTDQHKRKFLKDYQSPVFTIDSTHLVFHLEATCTRVVSRLRIRRQSDNKEAPLVLDGINLNLLTVQIDGQTLDTDDYQLSDNEMVITQVPDQFEFQCEVEINAQANTALEGLYLSSGNFCTQCEAEGFRYITYYIDRPDVMSVFSTEIHADQQQYPVLLSNGNLVDSGSDGARHWASWQDPYPKPSYLFALVAGDLACIEDSFTTRSSREVRLQIFTEHHNRDKCAHAMVSLQKAMQWDEDVFGLEYDLDLYMIVAVDDFNMGAMENKGLNVFNTRYVLANAETATDDDFLAIESVIAHEYFHNWTGNRVTCRDWFQLSLKEGLTVFRDQQFSADMFSPAIQRINDVRVLRNHQFSEDAGPMAHPVRPASYQEINNFYTATVYNKGAEVVRMMHCLLGVENFRKGMNLYFERHDGQAVTTDDFRLAMQDASGVNLERFQRWYQQAGTPRVDVKRHFDAEQEVLELTIIQQAGSTKGELNLAFHMPLKLALFDQTGRPLALDAEGSLEKVIDFNEYQMTLRFENIPDRALLSVFRGFSAPVILTTDLSDAELARLMACDNDPFNCWEAGQQLSSRTMLALLDSNADTWSEIAVPLIEAFRDLLSSNTDSALLAEMLVLPSEKYLAEMLDQVDVHQLRKVRDFLRLEIARHCEQQISERFHNNRSSERYRIDADSMARRGLKNVCMTYLMLLQKEEYFDACRWQFEQADNMTDQIACLQAIVHHRHALREQILGRFYQQWKDTPLVLDKWFSVIGSTSVDDALELIRPLFEHPDYSLQNPNRARSLLGSMIANSSAFHQSDGAGYQFAAEKVLELDAINPQVAARLANPFVHWRKLVTSQGLLLRSQIESMLGQGEISNDLNELLSTSLKD